MALTKGCNDANDSEVSWTTWGGCGRFRGLCRMSFSKVPCQQTGSPCCSGKGVYCSVPARDIKALRSLLVVGLQTTTTGSSLQHGGLFYYYLLKCMEFSFFPRRPKEVCLSRPPSQKETKPGTQSLMRFLLRSLKGRFWKTVGEEKRLGKERRSRGKWVVRRGSGTGLGCAGLPCPVLSLYSPHLHFGRTCLDHMLPGPLLSEKKGGVK